MKREIKITADGSPTIYLPEWNESYHSKHGALQEALHVFIDNGWMKFYPKNRPIYVLEYGFGTGFNALLTSIISKIYQQKTIFHSIEKYPIAEDEFKRLNMTDCFQNNFKNVDPFEIQTFNDLIFESEWNKETEIHSYFDLMKIKDDFKTIELEANKYDIIYFDAFGIRVQPNLWTESVFEKAYHSLVKDGLLTTYACNGTTKRALKNVGFEIEKLVGPPGKREMINAWKK